MNQENQFSLSNKEINSLNYSISRIFYENQEEIKSLKKSDEMRKDLEEMNSQLSSLYEKFTNYSESL